MRCVKSLAKTMAMVSAMVVGPLLWCKPAEASIVCTTRDSWFHWTCWVQHCTTHNCYDTETGRWFDEWQVCEVFVLCGQSD